jgi:hypothetical protein
MQDIFKGFYISIPSLRHMGINMYASDFGPDSTPEIFRFDQNILLKPKKLSRCSFFDISGSHHVPKVPSMIVQNL